MAHPRPLRHQGLHHQGKNHKAADPEHGQGGILHGPDEGREDLLRQTLRRKKGRLWAALSPQQHPHQNGGHCVDEVQSPAGCQTLKAAQAHYAQNEGWPRVITEGEQALRLAAGDAALPVQLTHGAPAHGVAPQKAQEKGRGPGPAYPEQQRRCRGQAAAHPLSKAQGGEKP